MSDHDAEELDSGPVETTVKIQAFCEDCAHAVGRPNAPPWGRRVAGYYLFEMQPGPDGKPWYLCAQHWFDGLHPNDHRKIGTGRVLVADPPDPPATALPVATPAPTKGGDAKAKKPRAKAPATPQA